MTYHIDEFEINKDLHRLNISKSRGADGLPPARLRETRIDITRSLKLLYSNIKRLSSRLNGKKELFRQSTKKTKSKC